MEKQIIRRLVKDGLTQILPLLDYTQGYLVGDYLLKCLCNENWNCSIEIITESKLDQTDLLNVFESLDLNVFGSKDLNTFRSKDPNVFKGIYQNTVVTITSVPNVFEFINNNYFDFLKNCFDGHILIVLNPASIVYRYSRKNKSLESEEQKYRLRGFIIEEN